MTKRLKLLELPKEIQEEVIKRRIKSSVAEELAFIKDKDEQSKLARLVAGYCIIFGSSRVQMNR